MIKPQRQNKMRYVTLPMNLFIAITMLCCATTSSAQDADIKTTKVKTVADDKNTTVDGPEKNNKKMVQEATINLGTTVTGNQEQPKVLYILPWQSPAPEEVDFESFENQQKSVFHHVEREELRREIESTTE